jgi:alkylated DNA repair dioxygenase AlkB
MAEEGDMTDACTLSYTPKFIQNPNDVFERLVEELPLQSREVVIQGKTFVQPRLISWHGPGRYAYSGLDLTPQPWPEDLLKIQHQLLEETKIDFNCVLCNYYRDENDSVGWHADDESFLSKDPVIATISLGAPRMFSMMLKSKKGKPDTHILENGSLFIMGAGVQKNWLHAILKSKVPCGPRLSLTYRVYMEPTR